MPPRKARPFDGVGAWNAYARRNPLPDGQWWPLKWIGGHENYADISRTHPSVFGVWREHDGTYTVAIKAEAQRRGAIGEPPHEVKRKQAGSLLELRTLLITLANT